MQGIQQCANMHTTTQVKGPLGPLASVLHSDGDEEKRGAVALQRGRTTVLDTDELERRCRWA